MTTWIAEEHVIFLHADGRRVPGRISISMPERVSAHEAQCLATLDGVHDKPQPIRGASTMQALLLAARFLGIELYSFLAFGGRVLYPDEDADVPLESLFGELLRQG